MTKDFSRRRFTKNMILGAGALAIGGSKLIQPARAQEVDGWTQKVVTAAARDLQNSADALNLYGPSAIDWQGFTSAMLALTGIARQFGFGPIMESLYGVDPDATQAVDEAWAEGGWDQWHALTSVPLIGLEADFMPNFDQVRSYIQSDTWISGQGPLSSDPFVQGWAEYAPFSSGFEDPFLDDFTRETIGGTPWYQSTSTPYIPRVPVDLCCIIWTTMLDGDKCKKLQRITKAMQGMAIVPLGVLSIPYKIAIAAGVWMVGVMADRYCGKI